jgi:DNA-binding beta-propeller fold protein YncE
MQSRPRSLGVVALLMLVGSMAASSVAADRLAPRVRRLPLHAAPLAVTIGSGSLWVLAERGDAAVVLRLDPASGTTLAVIKVGRPGPDMGAISFGGGRIWAAAGEELVGIDPARHSSVIRHRLPGVASAISYGFGSVWVTTLGQSRHLLVRLDSRTLAIRARIWLTSRTGETGETAGPSAVAAGLGSVWVAGFAALLRIDPKTDRIASYLFPTSPSSTDVAVARHRLWVLGGTAVAALDRHGHRSEMWRLPTAGGRIAVADNRLWVIDNCGCRHGTLLEIDPSTRRVLRRFTTGETPIAVAATPAVAWVATFADGTVASYTRS